MYSPHQPSSMDVYVSDGCDASFHRRINFYLCRDGEREGFLCFSVWVKVKVTVSERAIRDRRERVIYRECFI